MFIDQIYSKATKRNYESNKIVHNHIDEIRSTDIADMVVYKISNNKGFRDISIITDNFSSYLWCAFLKNKNRKLITEEF